MVTRCQTLGERMATVEEHCRSMDGTLQDIKKAVAETIPKQAEMIRTEAVQAVAAGTKEMKELKVAVNGRLRRIELAVAMAIGIAIGSGVLGATDALKVVFGGG